MSPELKTFLIAMSPIVELRGAIPLALAVYKLPVLAAYFLSVLGNLVPLTMIILFLRPISSFLSSKSSFLNCVFSWLFEHTKARNQSKIEQWGRDLAIVILVAIPLPFIGGWTGAIAAVLLQLPTKKGLLLVATGAAISGLIVLLLIVGLNGLLATWFSG